MREAGGEAHDPSEPVEHHIEVSRTARYWTLGDPSTPTEDVWFVLHGYKQLARRFIRRFRRLAAPGRLVVAPEALSRFYVRSGAGRHGPDALVGGTWMTREDRDAEIRDYVGYLDRLAEALPRAARRRVTVLGFSQGAATAARWATYGSVEPNRLVLWGDFVPPDLDMDRAAASLGDTDLVLVRGERDRSLDPRLAEDEAQRLRAAGIAHRTVTYPGEHEIDDDVLAGLADM